MKNKELFNLYAGLEKVSKLYRGARFSYGVSKNKKIILEELNTIEEIKTPGEKYKEYDKKRIELCERMSYKNEDETVRIIKVKDNNGNTISSSYDIKDKKKFNHELNELQKENKEAIDEYNEVFTEYTKLLDDEIKIELFKIKLETVSDDITPEILGSILEIIEE